MSVALSSADCAARRSESGLLQQLLLLVFAAAPHTATAQLAALSGAAVASWPLPAAASGGAGAEAAPAPRFSLFVVARRVTVALVHRPADLQSLLDVEARPYISSAACLLPLSPACVPAGGVLLQAAPSLPSAPPRRLAAA